MKKYIIAFFLWSQCVSAKPLVVTSFSILADWVQVLAGPYVNLETIVGPNEDAHVFEPTPHTLKLMLKADLIVAYGFGFECWFDRLVTNENIVYVTKGLKPLHLFDATQNKTIQDPHAWHNLTYAAHNCQQLALALQDLLPEKKEEIQHNLEAYLMKLKTLDNDLKRLFSSLTPQQKMIITTHDGFGYYAMAYGIKFLSIMGLSTESQPSAKTLMNLVHTIRTHGIKTLFLENITNDVLINQLANETGVNVKGPLYSDALSEKEGPASTFLKLMAHNSQLFFNSMKDIQ